VLLVTGGVSVGKYDFVKETLDDLGVEIKFWQVNIKPGKPLVFGRKKKTLVFGLPGNPVSTGVTFLQFVRPAILKMSGRKELFPMKHSALLDHDLSKSDDKRHFLRAIAVQQNGELHVATTGTQSSGAMSSLSRANCLIVIPEGITALRKGERVEVEFL
jgi:molybdopterin molybdotransferase